MYVTYMWGTEYIYLKKELYAKGKNIKKKKHVTFESAWSKDHHKYVNIQW